LKAVITCAGLGSRLLPFTKELPKEMAPVFYRTDEGIQTKPLIQLIFENLFDVGIREFCFITGKTKRSIENHFTPDSSSNSQIMKSFYEKLTESKIFWTTQNSPKGFGDALRYADSFIGCENFILQAGDVSLAPNKLNFLKKILEKTENSQIDAVISVKTVDEPKRHGIVTLEDENNNTIVTSAIEKPDVPQTNLGIMPIYGFSNRIFESLKTTGPGKNNEVQVTDAIQKLIEGKHVVEAIRVDNEKFLDVGTPDAYWQALKDSHLFAEEAQ
jgi:UTP--glucose-1-phosphate uridylyltransferase|tara:strand:- start:2352 stop:3167 length:816 start_codon:yes stop_codon:yes gene_type:complete